MFVEFRLHGRFQAAFFNSVFELLYDLDFFKLFDVRGTIWPKFATSNNVRNCKGQ